MEAKRVQLRNRKLGTVLSVFPASAGFSIEKNPNTGKVDIIIHLNEDASADLDVEHLDTLKVIKPGDTVIISQTGKRGFVEKIYPTDGKCLVNINGILYGHYPRDLIYYASTNVNEYVAKVECE